jgi:hypothetical protein
MTTDLTPYSKKLTLPADVDPPRRLEFEACDAELVLLLGCHGLEADPVAARQQQSFSAADAQQQRVAPGSHIRPPAGVSETRWAR